VTSFVRRIDRAVSFEPRDARFVPSLRRPRLIPSRNGLAVRRQLLGAVIRARLLGPWEPRRVVLPTRVLVPKETTWRLTRRYRYYVSVSRAERRLRLFEHLRPAKTYVIAVGRAGLETPAGLYRIDDKQVNPSWHVPRSAWAGSLAGRVIPPGPDDPLKARWMGFYDGSGIHGTDNLSSLGTAASHGCIRMSISDVIELYDIVPLHTPIFIQ
jgi:lipoprotein-anchoring transpeptidase ErfK/SrfK